MRRTSGACPIPFLSRGRRTGPRPPRTRSSPTRTEGPRRGLGADRRVSLGAKGKGQIHVNFYSNDDLAGLLELILGVPFDG